MTEQETVDYFARLAKPRISELLRLNIQHLYDWAPGDTKSKFVADKAEVGLKLVRTIQPYGLIERFLTDDKVMGFVINPGLCRLSKRSLQTSGGSSS